MSTSFITDDEKDMIKDLDEKLQELNVQSGFSDTNLVFQSLEKIKRVQSRGCSSILKSFLILSVILFIARVIIL